MAFRNSASGSRPLERRRIVRSLACLRQQRKKQSFIRSGSVWKKREIDMKHNRDTQNEDSRNEGRRKFLLLPRKGISPPAPAAEALPKRQGRIGLGTWKTQADFRQVHVTQGRKSLYEADFASGSLGWPYTRGEWLVAGGVYRQLDLGEDRRAYVGDAAWTDYTLTLQARKLGGQEGFLIFFHVHNDSNYCVWAIGGDGNTHSVLAQQARYARTVLAPEAPCRVERDRWYDLKVNVAAGRIRCWLDGKFIHKGEHRPIAAS